MATDNIKWPEEPQEHCRWAETPRSFKDMVVGIVSPYEKPGEPPPFCYPGTTLDPRLKEFAAQLLPLQVNLIGTHTHNSEPEQGFGIAGRMEREAIWMLAGVISPGVEDIDQKVDGYFCGGGTEANDMGMWIGRQWLRQHPDPFNRGIAVLCTPLTHYSIHKAAAKLDIGQSNWSVCPACTRAHIFVPDPSGAGITLVGMNQRGEMRVGYGDSVDYEDLGRIFALKYEEGFRRFMIVPTVGTTDFGSIDHVERIGRFIREYVNKQTLAHCYLHVDASIGGFTVPFAVVPEGEQRPRFGFDVKEVMSIAVDGDKMGQLPYPAGIFLCRKSLQRLVERQVMYIGSHEDDTFCGSRTALAPVLAWYQFQQFGQQGQREYVQKCIAARDELKRMLDTEEGLRGWVETHSCSPYTNTLPTELRVESKSGEVPAQLCERFAVLAPYMLRADNFPTPPEDPRSCPQRVYKLSIWPHTIPFFKQFVNDLARAKAEWANK